MNFKAFFFLSVAFIAMSFTQRTFDECVPYFPMTKGTTWTYNEYDKNGELSGTNETIVQDVIISGSRVEYKLKGIHDGPKQKEKDHHEMEFSYTCEDGVFKMSMETMIDKKTLESMGESATIEIDQTEMEFPNSLKPGDQLKDANITVKVSMGGMSVMNMRVDITDRKCEKIESITTEAGTYDCALLSYNVKSDMGFVKTAGSTKDWYSSSVGIVMSENYDDKGQLQGSRKLVAYKAGQ